MTDLDRGHTFIAETRVSSVPAGLSAEPDVMVVSHQALDDGRVRLTPKASGEPDRYIEVEGGPRSDRRDPRRQLRAEGPASSAGGLLHGGCP